MARIEYTLKALNQRLKDSQVKVRVKQRGGILSLVATLPLKPSDLRPRPYQHTIALGTPASGAGFK